MQETQETQPQSLGWEDPLKEAMATHLLGGGRYFSTQFISSTLNFLLFLLKMCSY